MRAKAGLIILLGLFLIIGMVSAAPERADFVKITPSYEWVVADGESISTINVWAKNISSDQPVPLAQVTFTVDDPVYGQMSSSTATTDATGIASSNFKVKTKSGTAVITVTVTSEDTVGPSQTVTYTKTQTAEQKIDHNQAVSASFDNPSELPVGSTLTLVVTVTDQYGNLVDNKNALAGQHTFNLYMTDAVGRGFYDGSGYTLNKTAPPLQTDALGTGSVQLRIANVTCRNMIFMQKIGSMSHNPETWIDGLAIQDPAYMVQDDPVPYKAIADGVEYFQLSYHVYDTLMNPINGTLVHIASSDGTSTDKYSVNGLIYIEYGPKTEAQTNTINVTSANTTMVCQPTGTTGSCVQDVMFINGGPVDILLSGSPGTMVSLDQASGTKEGIVRAVVVDGKGNPVNGEDVTFNLIVETIPAYRTTDGGPYVETTAPALTTVKSGTSLTNKTAGGAALAFFSPGAFSTSGPLYSSSATGNATVTATWGGITKEVRFSWKNYPTLSVKVPGDLCKDVHVGDTIDMSMSVLGDGAALAPNPIDAMLVMDKSTSMNGAMDGHSRIYWASQAGSTFVGQMDSSRDKVGLTSYCAAETVDYGLSDQFTNVIAKINSLPSSTCGYTGTRKALKTAIEQFPPYDPASKSVRAIILLTDGEFNYYADPLARGYATSTYNFGGTTHSDRHTFFSGLPAPSGSSTATGGANQWTNQNMSEYAMSKNIRIYTISVSPDLDSSKDTWKVLDNLALSTGGKHFHANTGAALQNYYTQIAGELVEKAGGDAEITLDFSSAKDGTTGALIDVKQYMDYVYLLPDSSHTKMVNKTSTIFDYTQDDRPNWTNGLMAPGLYFKAGEMNLNDFWTLNFKVKLLKSGNVHLFGSDDTKSAVCFKDVKTGQKTCTMVEAIDCPVKEDTGGGFTGEVVTIDITSATNLASDPKTLTINWDATYTGKEPVEQTVSYKPSVGGHYTTIYTVSEKPSTPTGFPTKSYTTTVDTSLWPPGDYTIRVIGNSGKASHSDNEPWTKFDTTAQVFLKLE